MRAMVAVVGMAVLGIVAFVDHRIGGEAAGTIAQGVDGSPSHGLQEGDDAKGKGPPDSRRVDGDGSPRLELPKVIPGSSQGVVFSNPGASVAVSRFYRLLQDKELKASNVISAPFQLDGRKELTDDKEVQAFIDKAREGSLKKGRTNTVLSMTFLPTGNSWEEAQRWLGTALTGERAKAIYDHAEKHNAWLVLVLLARTNGDTHTYEHTLIAVTNVDSEVKARVIGFMD